MDRLLVLGAALLFLPVVVRGQLPNKFCTAPVKGSVTKIDSIVEIIDDVEDEDICEANCQGSNSITKNVGLNKPIRKQLYIRFGTYNHPTFSVYRVAISVVHLGWDDLD